MEDEYFEDNEGLMLTGTMQKAAGSKCAQYVHNPTVHVYYALKQRIETSPQAWLHEFLDTGGLGSLVDTVEQLSNDLNHGFNSLSDAIVQLDCIACVRALLNTNLGMNYMIVQENYTRKLVLGLDTPNTLAKKHLFEILTAECVFSAQGHARVVDAFNHFKAIKLVGYRFSPAITELDEADTSAYRTTMVAFINAVIMAAPDVRERNKIRNELISVQLLDVLRIVRKDDKDPALAIQLQIFIEQKHRDESELKEMCGIDVNSHQDLFHHLFQKVLGTPEALNLLGILQDITFMDHTSSKTQRSALWEALAATVHQVCSMKTGDEVTSFMERLAFLSPLDVTVQEPPERRDSSSNDIIVAGAPGLLERTDSGISACSAAGSAQSHCRFKKRTERQSGVVTRSQKAMTQKATETAPNDMKSLPTPKQQMKSLKWIKIDAKSVRREVSMWGRSDALSAEAVRMLDFETLEKQFATSNTLASPEDELELLSGERCLAVNLFLSRVEESPEEIIDLIRDADLITLGASTLRYLHAVLPTDAEIRQLREYQGSRLDLGQAEQFLLSLSDLPGYQYLLVSMLFKADFKSKSQHLRTSFMSLTQACKDVLYNAGLRFFMHIILEAGNFVNQGTSFGSAGGFKLSSLARITEVKGQDPGTDLLSHLVSMVERQKRTMLNFANDLRSTEKAASLNLDDLKKQVTELNNQLRNLLEQLSMAPLQVRDKFNLFIEDVKRDLSELQENIATLRSLTQQMAIYFCEDYATFDLKQCLQQILNFCLAIRRSQKDLVAMDNQREAAEEVREDLNNKCIEQEAARVFGNKADACSSFAFAHVERLVDNLLIEVHSGRVQAGMGSKLNTEEDEDTLYISRIAPSSPTKELSSLTIHQPSSQADHITMSDRIDNYIGHQYRRGNQIETASFLNSENKVEKDAVIASPEVFSVRVLPKIPAASKPTSNRPTHRRTNSELNDSRNPSLKWRIYENKKAEEKKKQVTKVESSKALASLSLEMQPRVTRSRDNLQRQNSNQDKSDGEAKDGKGKRKSLEFFRRIGRAVLGSRSSQNNIENNNDKPLTRKTKKQSSKRKESNSSDNQDGEKENKAASYYDNVSPSKTSNEKVVAIKVYPSYR